MQQTRCAKRFARERRARRIVAQTCQHDEMPVDDETPLIRAEVDQEFVDRIQVGQAALVRDDTHAGASWHGRVLRVAGWYEQRRPTSQDPSAFTDIRTVECLISIDRGQPLLRIGQRMRVLIGRVPSTGGE